MGYQTFLRYHQTLDVYSRSTAANPSGQKIASWELVEAGVPCTYQPLMSEKRLSPHVQDIDEIRIVVPHPFAGFFNYGDRIQDVRDRYGDVIMAGPLEIVEILRSTGWNGKLTYLSMRARLVVQS